MGKREIARYEQISPFPTVFSKGLFPMGRQKVSLCGNGLSKYVFMCNSLTDAKNAHFFELKTFAHSQCGSKDSIIFIIENKGRKHCCWSSALRFLNHLCSLTFLSHRCPLFRHRLYGKAASGLEKMLCGVLVKKLL